MSTVIRWPDDYARAVAILKRGEVLAYPTEAVFGLGGDARNPAVAEAVLALKAGRARGKGMILVVGEWWQCADWVAGVDETDFTALTTDTDPRQATTFIFPAAATIPSAVRHCDGGIAIRRSTHPVVLALCAALGRPLISTSANLPGMPPACDVATVRTVFPNLPVIDAPLGGATRPSKIIDWASGRVLRA